MQSLMDITARVKNIAIREAKSDLVAIGVFSEADQLNKSVSIIDRQHGGGIKDLLMLGDFTGKKGTTTLVYGHSGFSTSRVLLVGLGKKADLSLDDLRKASINAANEAIKLNAKSIDFALHQGQRRALAVNEMAQSIVEGAFFGAYRYDEFIAPEMPHSRPKRFTIQLIDEDANRLKELRQGVKYGSIIGEANNFARTVANRPGNVINPPSLAKLAQSVARKSTGLSCRVFDKKKLTELGMGGILAVGAGSQSDPRMIILKHKAKTRSGANRPTVAIVGKAITFDAGGISIKPAANMDQMKFDKTGGVVVLATMKAIAELNLDLNVLGIIPSAENVLGGCSYRPGDIITTYSGKTVEIINTDAEGRMILSDGIAWADEQKVDIIIDIATLTGACMVALGKHQAGVFSNDDELLSDLKQASVRSGEKVWHLPCSDEYVKDMRSKVADLKNCGPRWGGASTAAAFLRQFAGDKTWAHLDIAGMDVYDRPGNDNGSTSSGFGVRLLTSYIMSLSKK